MTTDGPSALMSLLDASPVHRRVTNHRIFSRIAESRLGREDVSALVGQYWYPIHQFPSFLARLIAEAPRTRDQTIISRILWQELGEGDPARSHEQLYIDTMAAAEIDRSDVVNAPPLPSTRALVDGYARAAGDYLTGVGWLYGTEVIDLSIVVGLGRAVRQLSGKKDLPWVTIHAKQEPSHVRDASDAVAQSHSDDDCRIIVSAAEEAWRLWAELFTELERGMDARASSRSGEAREGVK